MKDSIKRHRPNARECLLKACDNTPALTDAAIVDQVRYVRPDDPDIPGDWAPPTDLGQAATRRPGYRLRIALWDGQVIAVIYFPIFQFEPRPQTLICAYRYARLMQQATKLQQRPDEGSAS